MASLAAGASYTSNQAIALPYNMAPGTYYLGVIADYTGQQSETIETNNDLTGVVVNAFKDIDLVMTAVSTLTPAMVTGDTAIVSITVKNQGTTPAAGGHSAWIYLSQDAAITTADTRVGYWSAPMLVAGESASADVVVTLPIGMAAGSYYLGAIADGSNSIQESVETNNALTGMVIDVTAGAPKVDLIMTSVTTASTTLAVGSTATVSTIVKYQGNSKAVSVTSAGIYLSTDSIITTDDILIGTRPVAALTAGTSWIANTSVTIPTDLPPGNYYLGTIADYNNIEVESVETNNALTGAMLTITQ